jgi:hypothetical protein
MIDKQPKALVLAEKLEHQVRRGSYDWERVEPMMLKAAAELRRLQAEVEMQFQALKAARQLVEACYQSAKKDEALLRQALEVLERVLPLAKDSTTQPSLDIDILDAVSAIAALRERLNHTKES